jgi:hypothetical protein
MEGLVKKRKFIALCKKYCWQMRRMKAESCLCKACENLKVYEDGLSEAVTILRSVYGAPGVDGVIPRPTDGEEVDEIQGAEQLQWLYDFVDTDRRIDRVENCLCKDAFKDRKMDCIRGKCHHCGFKHTWSKGLRLQIVVIKKDAAPGLEPCPRRLTPNLDPVSRPVAAWGASSVENQAEVVAI